MLGPSGPIGADCDLGFGRCLTRLTLSKAVAFAIHLQDVDVVGQSVE